MYEDSAETAEGHARLQGVTGERVTLLKYLYALSIALLVFALVVFGTAAFPTPQAPDYPPELASVDQYPTDAQQQLLDEQSQSQQVFQEQVSVYNQVLSFVIIGAAVALLAGSILWLRSLSIISEGVTLGAVFTLLYGLYAASSMGARVVSFITVAVGLVILLALVYWKFVYSPRHSGWNPEQGQQPNSQHEQSNSVGSTGKKD